MGQQTRRVDYRAYINSREWSLRRADALLRSISERHPRCEFCGRAGDSHKNRSSDRERVDGSNGLEVHHLHYRNLGNEAPEDLIVLCTDVLYLDEHNAQVEQAMRGGELLPPIPENVGCHERCHRDPAFRAAVQRIAAKRR